MGALKGAAMVVFAVLLGAICSPNARADEWNKQTTVKVHEPIEVPGRVLNPGTYVFKLYNSDADRDIVQIWSAHQMRLLDTIDGIPAYRENPPGHTVLKFSEEPKGRPEELTAWFYPGDASGVEFVYPQRKTAECSCATGMGNGK